VIASTAGYPLIFLFAAVAAAAGVALLVKLHLNSSAWTRIASTT
jgi:hypothetical protein